jgi:hypothetical protein
VRSIMGMILGCWLVMVPALLAQESADSLQTQISQDSLNKAPVITYVIPAGPEAGSFTEASRLQVVDTVAGWAKILVEGWVPVEKILPRMTSETQVELVPAEPAKVKKAKIKEERPQCIATTTKGERCTRKAISGSKKCWQHSQ